jgi:hypothetical protein
VPNTFLDVNTTTGRLDRKTALDVSAGSADAGKVVALNSSGKLDATLFDSATLGGGGDAILCTEALAAGDWVNIFLSAGVRKCRKALAADGTKPAHAYVLIAVSSGASATVFRTGTNTKIALTGFTASDIGGPLFLSDATSGGSTKTPPTVALHLLQRLGFISDVTGSFVEAQLDMSYEILL